MPLLPKLARPNLKLRGDIRKIEKLIIDEFKRTSLPFSEFQPKNDWDVLALAQHHGLPTRLLDWTYSALIALWFAVKDEPFKERKEEDGIVWLLAPETKDFRTDTEKYSPSSNRITRIFRPNALSRRITAQSGIFTAHKILQSAKVIKLETHKTFSKKLTKIIISPSAFPKIRERLHILGINNLTVFPDLDGLCAHLQWRYSYKTDEKS